MIPEEDKAFEKLELPPDTLRKYGFESSNEFNSFRYSDYCFKKFIDFSTDYKLCETGENKDQCAPAKDEEERGEYFAAM